MRKIGLYVQRTNADGLREMCERIRPAVVLVHLDGGEDFIHWLKATLPETFIVGRLYWTQQQQNDMMLIVPGADVAGMVLASKGAQSCDAFMLFNECMTSPVDHGGESAFRQRAARLDRMQVDFRAALVAAGKEAVAFNFGAGNWSTAEHYREHFPSTMAEYKFFGFHVYGWPKLTSGDWHSNLDETLRIVDALGTGQPRGVAPTCILTEMAVTRAYANPGPDEGWLSQGDGAPLSLDAYAADLAAVNDELCKRTNVMGACLFNAAGDHTWTTFAVTSELVDRLAALPECGPVVIPSPVVQPVRLWMPFDHANPASVISQWYGDGKDNPAYEPWAHEGIDFALPLGTPVLAACDGVVDVFKASAAYGTYVRILSEGTLETADGGKRVAGKWQTVYAHLSKRTVTAGQVVKAGDVIGEVGSTGNSTGNHLHFGLRLPGQKPSDPYWGYSDPSPWLGLKRVIQPVPQTAALLIEQAMALLVKAKELMT